jgi:hypothetical protein
MKKKLEMERLDHVTGGCGGGGGRGWGDGWGGGWGWGFGGGGCQNNGNDDGNMMQWLLPFLFTMMKDDRSGGRRR